MKTLSRRCLQVVFLFSVFWSANSWAAFIVVVTGDTQQVQSTGFYSSVSAYTYTGAYEVHADAQNPFQMVYLYENGVQISVGLGTTIKYYSSKPAGTYIYTTNGSSYSATVQVRKPSTPTLTAPSTDNNGAYTISWSSSTGASYYQLQEYLSSWSTIVSANQTSVARSGRSNGIWYYRARACSALGCSGWTGNKSVIVANTPATPATPTGPGTDYDGAYTISWSAVTSTSYYQLQEKLNSGGWATIHSASSRSKSRSGRTIGTWYYHVRACTTVSTYTTCGGWSGNKSVVVKAPGTPGTLTGPATDYDGTYTINWSAVTGAASYQLFESADNVNWSSVYYNSATSTSRTVGNNGTWYYKLKACSVVGCSGYSGTLAVGVPAPGTPGSPTGDSVSNDGEYTLSWGATTGAADYEWQERQDGGAWGPIQITTVTSITLTARANGVWDYQIRACNNPGCSSWSGIKSVNVTPPPSFSIDDPSITEGGVLTFRISKNGPADRSYSINYATANGSAGSNDYTPVTLTTLTFAANVTYTDVTVTTLDETPGLETYENNETVYVNLSGATGGTTISKTQGVGTILNDDSAPIFSINDIFIVESDGNLIFTVTRTGLTEVDHAVSYATAEDTGMLGNNRATSGVDYTPASGVLNFLSSDGPTKTITIAAIDDSHFEYFENFLVNLSNPTNGASLDPASNSGTGNIVDDEPSPYFTVSDATANEAAGTITFLVRCDGFVQIAQTVGFILTPVTAQPLEDYQEVTNTIVLCWDQVTGQYDHIRQVSIPVINDTIYEATETFTLTLTNPQGGAIIGNPAVPSEDGEGIGTITDEGDTPTISIGSITATEGNALTFTVALTGNTSLSHTVNYATADATAISGAGNDYEAQSGSLTFLSGELSKPVTVTTFNEDIYELDETLLVNISGATNGAIILDSQGIGTIGNDDTSPTFSISDVSVAEGQPVNFTVTRTGATELNHDLTYETANHTALAGNDYTYTNNSVTISGSNQLSATQTISIPSIDDTDVEVDETFYLNLTGISDAIHASITGAQAIGTLRNNDVLPAPPPHVELAPDPALFEVLETDTVGTTAGNFRVDESGAATYNIPIATAAGTAGVTPQISLNYSSQGGSGLLGLGWNLSGLSAISRCRQTLAQDRNPQPISWNANDRFCLDGQRLLLISGSYGAPGSQYKTEIDSFATITAISGTSGMPDYFTVARKDGSISYYGINDTTSLSKLKAGTNTLNWAIDRFEDSVGNPITFDYSNDANGQHIKTIGYAYGNNASPGATITFNYSLRADTITGYIGGYSFTNKLRLDNIVSNNGVTELRHYTLFYDEGAANIGTDVHSRLTSLQECAGASCLPKTTFNWALPTQGIQSGAAFNFTVADGSNYKLADYKPADINGDGILDLIWIEWFITDSNAYRYLHYAISDGATLTPASFADSGLTQLYLAGTVDQTIKLEVLDYNVDGRQDLMVWSDNAIAWKLFLSEPQADGSWKLYPKTISLPFGTKNVRFGDTNADGLVDATYRRDGNYYRRHLQRNGLEADTSNLAYEFGSEQSVTLPTFDPIFSVSNSSFESEQTGDFNGDGLADAIMMDSTDIPYVGILYQYYPVVATAGGYGMYGDGTDNPLYDPNNPYYNLRIKETRIADLNGDGLSDLIWIVHDMSNSQYNWYYALSTGTGFAPRQTLLTTGTSQAEIDAAKQMHLADYNQDGHPDIIQVDINANVVKAYIWQPQSNNFAAATTVISFINDGDSHALFDLTGDGIADYMRFDALNERFYLHHSVGSGKRNLITRITNGLGAVTDITFGALNATDHYNRVDPAAFGTLKCWPGYSEWTEFCFNFSSVDYSHFNDPFSDLAAEQSLQHNPISPVLELNGPLYVVTRVAGSAPIAGGPNAQSAISYYYSEAKLQAAGRGLLGFKRLRTLDEQTGVSTLTIYRQDFPFIGHPWKTEVRTDAGHLLSYSENSWQLKGWLSTWPDTAASAGTISLGPLQPFLNTSIAETYDLVNNGSAQGALLSTVSTTSNYDIYGNPTQISVDIKDGIDTVVQTKTVTNQYGTTTWEQEMGRLSDTTTTTTRGLESRTRSASFTYYTSGAHLGLLESETIEPGGAPNQTLTTTYQYDLFGNKIRATQTGMSRGGLVTRYSRSEYDTDGRYLERTYNNYEQKTSEVISRNALGQPTEVADINDVHAYSSYTPLGRKYFERVDTGGYSTTYLSDAYLTNCPTGTAYKTLTTSAGGGASQQCYDQLARVTRKLTNSFDGSWIAQDTEYGNLGRTKRQSGSYTLGTTLYWTTIDYDILGRPTQAILPDSTITTTIYAGLITTNTNALGQTHTEEKNVLGEVIQVTDHLNSSISYQYDPLGNMEIMTDPAGNITTIVYDNLDRKESLNDPDKGFWTYDYNAFGELINQADANGQSSDMYYDDLGRLFNRIDYRADISIEGDTTWIYNNQPNPATSNGLGQLLTVEDTISNYRKDHGYDDYGRPMISTTRLGPDGIDGIYSESQSYDQYGRIHQSFDAANNPNGAQGIQGTENYYNPNGYLEEIADAADLLKPAYRTITDMDARGNITAETRGDGTNVGYTYDPETGRLTHINGIHYLEGNIQDLTYQWDALGNLQHRLEQSGGKNLKESFCYDNLNRLVKTHADTTIGDCTGIDHTNGDIQYSVLGNITYKNGVGNYSYGFNAGPHAVTSAGGINYTYDANGNNLTGDGRTITYSTFDKPIQIEKGGHTTQFKYGPDRARYKRQDTDINSNITTTIYIGATEHITRPDGSKEIKRYIASVALETLKLDASGEFLLSQETHYLYKDHLGSIDVITNEFGQVIDQLSFDPWGQRRNGIDWNSMTDAEIAAFMQSLTTSGIGERLTTRGYTGHEMLDETGIIHMNGRIYDPKLGRFLQADLFIQDPFNTQSLNRYSYVFNNPLAYTDPSGYFVPIIIGIIAYAAGAELLAVAIIVGVTSFVYTMAEGGSYGQALLNGISAFAFTYVGGSLFPGGPGGPGFGPNGATFGYLAAMGTLGGITTVLQGGNFGNGFITASVTAALGGAIGQGTDLGNALGFEGRTLARIVIGGTVSNISGGKFANGAITAAFIVAVESAVVRVQNGLGNEKPTSIFSDSDNIGEARGLYEDKVLVRKYGSPTATVTNEELETIKIDLEEIFTNGGDGGERLKDAIFSPDKQTTIIINELGINKSSNYKSFILTVDLKSQVEFLNNVNHKWTQFSTARILAHELGHAILGKSDIGFSMAFDLLKNRPSINTYPNVSFTDGVMHGINGTIRKTYSNFRVCSPNC